MNIADLRKSYEKAELSEDASDANPLKQFERWLNEAIQSEVPEPNAMTVATVASLARFVGVRLRLTHLAARV